MRRRYILAGAVVVSLFCGLRLQAQQSDSSASNGTSASDIANPPASVQPASGTIPRLIKFAGSVQDLTGKVPSGVVGLTFSLYELPEGGNPLWTETQSLTLDAQGHYAALLGANSPEGLPLDLFTSSKALWLGVQAQLPGEVEQPRVLLVAVPYALKSSDADTLGGLPASAYMLSSSANVSESITLPRPISPPGSGGGATSAPITGMGTANYAAMFTGSSTIGSSPIFIGPTGDVGVGTTTPASALDVSGTGNFRQTLTAAGLLAPATGAAAPAQSFASYPLDFVASSFNIGMSTAVPQMFRWRAEPAGNNTANPSATLNLQFLSGSGTPAETGLSIASDGQINFATGQIFPGTGTITGVTAGTDLTGGGTSGSVTLNLDTSKVPTLGAPSNVFAGGITAAAFSGDGSNLVNVNAAYLNGQAASSFATLGSNTFTGTQTIHLGSVMSDANLVADVAQSNNGSLSPGLILGNGGEGIASKRTSGGNQYGLDFYTNSTDSMSITTSGSVGIGTNSPYTLLHLRKDLGGSLGPSLTLMNGGGAAGAGASIDFDGFDPGSNNPPAARIQSFDDGDFSSHLALLTKAPGGPTNALAERMRITSAGNVGIGTSTPAATLEVNGTTQFDSTVIFAQPITSEMGSFAASNSGETLAVTQGGAGAAAVLNATGPGSILVGENKGTQIFAVDNAGHVLAPAGVYPDPSGTNSGTLVPGVTFGGTSGGEGISSARAFGANNQFGLDFYTNFTNRMSITNGGSVGIGTTSPAASLDVEGPAAASGSNALPVLQVIGGAGGGYSSSSSVIAGQTGATINLTAGPGGVGLPGGPGGTISLTGGAGGSGYSGYEVGGGSGGSIILQPGQGGAPGSNGYPAGSAGNLLLAPNGGLVGVGTATPGATLEVNGTARFDQAVTFASGQTFPGTGTVTGVTAGTGLSGGGSSGNVTLTNAGLLGLTPGTGITSSGGQMPTLAIDTTVVPQLNAANNFSGNQSVAGMVGIGTTTPGALLDIEGSAASAGQAGTPALTVVGGQGGSQSAGGGITLTAGTGGGPGSGKTGGRGGAITLAGGMGGAGDIGGEGGTITIQPGTGGNGAPTKGIYGNLLLAPSGGLVGIGSSAPLATLALSGSESQPSGFGAAVAIANTASGGANWYLRVGATGTSTPAAGFSIADDSAYKIVVTTGSSSTFSVGIGTLSPDAMLSVNGSADKPSGGSWGTFSDARLKTVEGAFHAGLAQVLKLNPVVYRYKEQNALGINDHDPHVGFVAQDVEKVIPEAVSKDAQGYRLVNNDPILWTMLNAIKEQQAIIEKQQEQIRAQQAQIAQLASQVTAIQASLKEKGTLAAEHAHPGTTGR